jgi:alpha-mannosidase
VYEDSARQFQQLQRDGEALIERLAGRGETPLNTIACDRVDVIERGGRLSAWRAAPLAAAEPLDEDDPVTVRQATGQFILENRHLRAVFTTRGNLVSLIHRPTGRESLADEGNVFETYDDRPTNFDAWDVDPFHLETRRVCPPADTAAIVRGDPLRGEIRFERKIGRRSTLVQIARLDAHARRLELHHEVDWHEDQTMLKLAFPINARSMNATYEMQFHAVERPTHYNTPYDLARYEVPLHRWFDLGEHGFGVSILTESKYGGSTFGNTMRVSLLRAPLSPDPTCDRGRHAFAIALFPHAGDWRSAGTVAEAMRFNAPLRLVGHAPQGSFAAVDDPNLVLDTIKPAEDGRGIVLRLYEAHGGRGQAVLRLARPAGRAVFCNILEEELSAAPARGDTISLDYRPFQIISLRIE